MIKKISALLACAFLLTGVSACSGVTSSGAASDKAVTVFSVAGFDDTIAVTALWQELLSEHGYTLEAKQVDLAAGFAGVARGDLDGYLNAWLPSTHGSYVDKYKDRLDILEKPFYDNNRLLLAVPESMPENTISDVVKNAGKYGNRIVGIEAGAGMMKLLPDVLKKYEATDKLSIVAGSTPAMIAALKEAAATNQPVVTTLWQPYWAFSSLPVKALDDDLGAWPKPDGSYIVLSKQFVDKDPQVAKWMSNFRLSDEQYSSLMYDVAQASNPLDGAKKWLGSSDNRKAADSWFAG